MSLSSHDTTGPGGIKLLPPSFSAWSPTRERCRQIAVLMSGGVDSSIAAHLLKTAGWDVLGITMKVPVSCDVGPRGCCGADAAFVCNEMGLPHYFIDVTDVFERVIVEPFRRSYACGQTPNPCVDCNTFLKFAMVWDFVQETFGITHLATGHYARVTRRDGRACLCRAADGAKDQSYFLYGISARRLSDFVLPLGDLTKEQVRALAGELNLSVAAKAESMELCFAGEQDYRVALGDSGNHRPGEITDWQGRTIGTHRGIANYTLGQRRGLGVAGGKPLYVGRIDPVANTIALGTREDVMTHVVHAERVNILMPEAVVAGRQIYGKIRSYGEPKACTIAQKGDDRLTVEFAEPQFAPCPGQRLVLYSENGTVLCGGTIHS